jgi:hypothetical protein
MNPKTDLCQAKLHQRMYPNLSTVESDCKRMVANAKAYNAKNSPIYEDAERVRKTASNFMTKHNPAYRNPNYVAVATPIPDEFMTPPVMTPTMPPQKAWAGADGSRRSSQAESRLRYSESVAAPAEENEDEDRFQGKTFQEAQDQVVDELIHYSEYVD